MSVYFATAARARAVERAIAGLPTTVVFTQPGSVSGTGVVTAESQTAAQTVRISDKTPPRVEKTEAGMIPVRTKLIFLASGADVATGYRCKVDGDTYRVAEIDLLPGSIQATCVVTS